MKLFEYLVRHISDVSQDKVHADIHYYVKQNTGGQKRSYYIISISKDDIEKYPELIKRVHYKHQYAHEDVDLWWATHNSTVPADFKVVEIVMWDWKDEVGVYTSPDPIGKLRDDKERYCKMDKQIKTFTKRYDQIISIGFLEEVARKMGSQLKITNR